MAEVLLFHHAHGRTAGVLRFAERLRQAGHTVHVPDLYEGRIFEEMKGGLHYAMKIGIQAIVERGVRAADMLPENLVYAGFSLGVLPAQKLAQTRRGAAGALFFHGCAPVSQFGPYWPLHVPVQIHAYDTDKVFMDGGDLFAARKLVANANAAELFLYPGKGHIFTDSSLPSYDEAATTLVLKRVLQFLDAIR
ncbi:MAG: dienelactone hydrolase family protein [Acidobacterium ailaaui]|nr:dienelactone hydrolase family protein [Pseudacidobacterium ailaaui]